MRLVEGDDSPGDFGVFRFRRGGGGGGMRLNPLSTTAPTSVSEKAAAMHAAMKRAPFSPSPPWETLAAAAAYSAALSGFPGHTSPQVSMNI